MEKVIYTEGMYRVGLKARVLDLLIGWIANGDLEYDDLEYPNYLEIADELGWETTDGVVDTTGTQAIDLAIAEIREWA